MDQKLPALVDLSVVLLQQASVATRCICLPVTSQTPLASILDIFYFLSQVGSSGIRSLSTTSAPLSMAQILDVLLGKAKVEAEEAQVSLRTE